ncbi:F-box only protein 41-like [Limulus polyphemus]|uniref:F-box only protein 41-like n=1 Tax=Limulus polyphemus TaxID=6850 RepID=A0ABM1S3X3_LIMPO|nr:F-box only protein 41-like [Limulus polyphemus]XP_022238323.1 F-box only protein 41-like [Limulus polyphemus]XP_022238324.1 F-box only protein 41-like [Limulus polyphemus]XP_022238326.1 F-box only protein 41-like [Limulus polyphemus]XP_022238327.1 F-box only protein 41-like [Limulus polyphemus]XP_022238328.1 F-box only protein 41-like [Limulus polyphemus]XP_022238329.1 F-box only protein 41-like [Limulus polyphemus]
MIMNASEEKYRCPKCEKHNRTFKDLCEHVKYEHGLWKFERQEFLHSTLTRPIRQNLLKDFNYSLPLCDTLTGDNCINGSDKWMQNVIQQQILDKQNLSKDLEDLRKENQMLKQQIERHQKDLQKKSYLIEEQSRKLKTVEDYLDEVGKKEALAKEEMFHYVDDLIRRVQVAESECKSLRQLTVSQIKCIQEKSSPKSSTENEILYLTPKESLSLNLHQTSKIKAKNLIPRGNSPDSDSAKGESVTAGISDRQSLKQPLLSSQREESIMKLVFCYLDTNDMLNCRRVCGRWKNWIEIPHYWTQVLLINCLVTPTLMLEMSKFCTVTRMLTLQGVKVREKEGQESDQEYFKSTRGKLEPSFDNLLKAMQNSLTCLSIVACDNSLTERSLWQASCCCHYLEKVAYISSMYPASPEVLWSLGSGCRLLRCLIIPPYYPSHSKQILNNRCLLTIGRSWPNLQLLCIGGTEIDIRGLVTVAKHCQQLAVLELDHAGELQEDSVKEMCRVGLKKLEDLYLTHTLVTAAALLHIHENCSTLKKIKILTASSDYSIHSTSVQEYNKKLEELKALKKQSRFRTLLYITEW